MHINNKHINKALDFIVQNLGSEISVDDVARHCNLSKYHFNRLFRTTTGESVYSFIKKLKMEESAIFLGVNREKSITDIGMDYGYSASNYSSAFTKFHNISPLQFRKLKQESRFDLKSPFDNSDIIYQDFSYYDDKIEIKDVCDFQVLFEKHIGNYRDMSLLWPQFIKKYDHLRQPDTCFLDLSYNDPNLTDKDKCLFDLCMTIDDTVNVDLNNIKTICGGRFASFSFKGEKYKINQTYQGLFNIWLPQTQYHLDNRIGFDSYRHVNADADNEYIEIEINLPIKQITN